MYLLTHKSRINRVYPFQKCWVECWVCYITYQNSVAEYIIVMTPYLQNIYHRTFWIFFSLHHISAFCFLQSLWLTLSVNEICGLVCHHSFSALGRKGNNILMAVAKGSGYSALKLSVSSSPIVYGFLLLAIH